MKISTLIKKVDIPAYYSDELPQATRHDDELHAICPFHADTHASLHVSLLSGCYKCFACGAKGSIITFHAEKHHMTYTEAVQEFAEKLGVAAVAPDEELIAVWKKALTPGPILDALHARGISDTLIEQYTIGYDGERVTIPIYGAFGELVNIRRWSPTDKDCKMLSYKDAQGNTFGQAEIFGHENLGKESVYVCEGEWDKIIMDAHGFQAITSTAGAAGFNSAWMPLVSQSKNVYVCADNDPAGEALAELFKSYCTAEHLYILQWPTGTPQKYDVSDYFNDGKTDLQDLFYEHIAQPLTLAEVVDARNVGKLVETHMHVAGKLQNPFLLPKKVTFTCTEDCNDDTCRCHRSAYTTTINSSGTTIAEMCGSSDKVVYGILRRMCGCDKDCPVDIDIVDYQPVEYCKAVPLLNSEYAERDVYVVDASVQANRQYACTGYLQAHPKTQAAVLLFNKAIPSQKSIDMFAMSSELHERLKIFQGPPQSKMPEIHEQLEQHITHIWGRKDVAYAADLVYHSVLGFTFANTPVKRGWTEVLIIGDSGQAKTTIIDQLRAHYGAGALINGEAATRTGLVYTLAQINEQWYIKWGVLPLNDRGLVIIDELSGMPVADIAKMSEMRTSGVARCTQVITSETSARTRLIMIGNPRNGRQLSSNVFGVEAILKLIGTAEDIRRFDFAIGVAANTVSLDCINSLHAVPDTENPYTSELCSALVMWAWTRTPEQVHFTDEATDAILAAAKDMGAKYSSRIPLVEAADQRIKIARLSVALACRLFSTDETGELVIVQKGHVDWVVAYLNEQYSSPALHYDKFSSNEQLATDTSYANLENIRREFYKLAIVSRDISEVIQAIYLLPQRVTRDTISDAAGLDFMEVRQLIAFMLAKRMIEGSGDGYAYYKQPLLKEFFEAELLNPPTVEFITECREVAFRKVGI